MKKILYFIGHYDYLFYALMHNSQIVEPDTAADYICLLTQNDRLTIDFLRKKAEDISSKLGRFALVDDREFTNNPSEEETEKNICRKYNEILGSFNTNINDYDEIYMCFDEWNSFGIFLGNQQEITPPVSVMVKFRNQLSLDIYHYLDVPGSRVFSRLQKKYNVLGCRQNYIRTVWIENEQGIDMTDESGIRWKSDFAIDNFRKLSDKQYKLLCSFFECPDLDLLRSKKTLLVADSNWFTNNTEYPELYYKEAYRDLINLFCSSVDDIIFKWNPRYYIENAFIGTEAAELLPYVPSELITYYNDQKYTVLTCGNPEPYILGSVTEERIHILNSFYRQHDLYIPVIWCCALAHKLGKRLFSSEISDADKDNLRNILERHGIQGNVDNSGELRDHDIVLLRSTGREDVFENIKHYLNNKNTVIIYDLPHNCFSGEQYDELKDNMTVYSVYSDTYTINSSGSMYRKRMAVFYPDSSMRSEAADKMFGFTALGIRFSETKEAYLYTDRSFEKYESKDYIMKRSLASPVVIYGATEIAKKFLQQHGHCINVRCVMKDAHSKVDPWIAAHYKVVPFSYNEIRHDEYVIICKSFTHNIDIFPEYAVSRDEFLRRGYHVCRDFIYYRIVDAYLTDKQIMLFCGYCEMSGVKQILDLTSAVDYFCMLFYHIGRETMEAAPGYADFVATARLCDILVHAPLVMKRGVLDNDVLSLVSPETELIFIPQLTFRGYAPYKNTNVNIRNRGTRLFGIMHYPFLYEITPINKMINEGKTDDEILEKMLSPDLYTKEEVLSNFKTAMKILYMQDRESDIPIADYIEDHYREDLMFKDCIHANDAVFFEYARRLSDYLEIDCVDEIDEVQKVCRKNGAYFQVATEEPVLPSVAKHLGLKFAKPTRRYMQKITEEHIRMRTIRYWLSDYCKYYRAASYLRKTFHTNYLSRKVTIYRNEEDKYRIDISSENKE